MIAFPRGLPALALIGLTACAPVVLPGARPVMSEAAVPLHGHALKLHLSAPPREQAGDAAVPVLLVYTTGDAGWWGKDRDIFTHLKAWGYPVVGFSAREYVHHLGTGAVSPQQIAEDFAAVVRTAESVLGLPSSTRAVLVGKSRGAGLSVAAAGRFSMSPGLAGVLAVGLTREEEYVYRGFHRRSRPPVMLQTYGYLPRLGRLPVAVIQSTRDNYVPAEEARRLFGPDTSSRELVPIDSRNHNFDGALDRLYDEMERSIQWIVQR